MKKFSELALVLASAALLLTGCGRAKLTVSDHYLKADGLAVVIKGETNQKRVSYQIGDAAKKTVKSQNSAYTVMVPVQTNKQTVHLSAGSKKQTVTVDAVKSLGSYAKIKQAFDQGLVLTQLSAKDQKTLMGLQQQGQKLKADQQKIAAKVAADQKAIAQNQDPEAVADLQQQAQAGAKLKAAAQSLQQQQAAIQPKLVQAQQAVKDQQLPVTAKDGIHNLQKNKEFLLRANVNDQKVNALAVAVPVKVMKNKAKAKDFILKFSTLASAVGADPKDVLKQFKKNMDTDKSSQTTIKTIHSNGVTFSIGLSADQLYIYLLK